MLQVECMLQHAGVFRAARCTPNGVEGFSSENPMGAQQWPLALERNRVLIMTAQTFLNMLDMGVAELQAFSLMVSGDAILCVAAFTLFSFRLVACMKALPTAFCWHVLSRIAWKYVASAPVCIWLEPQACIIHVQMEYYVHLHGKQAVSLDHRSLMSAITPRQTTHITGLPSSTGHCHLSSKAVYRYCIVLVVRTHKHVPRLCSSQQAQPSNSFSHQVMSDLALLPVHMGHDDHTECAVATTQTLTVTSDRVIACAL